MFKRLAICLAVLFALTSTASAANYQFANRAWMTTATAGTGTVTLGSAQAGYLTFAQAGVPDQATVSYVIIDGNNFEMGRGVYTASGTTMTRATVFVALASGVASTSLLSLSGSATVYLTPSAQDLTTSMQGIICPTPTQSLTGGM